MSAADGGVASTLEELLRRYKPPAPGRASATCIVATDKWRACLHTRWAFVEAKPLRCPDCEAGR